MRVALLGHISVDALRAATGLRLSTDLKGLGQTPVVPLAAGLLRRGHAVTIIACDEEIESEVRVSEGDLNLIFVPFRKSTRDKALSLYSDEIRYLRSALSRTDADIVHAHWNYEFAGAVAGVSYASLLTCHDAPFKNIFLYRAVFFIFRFFLALKYTWRMKNIICVSPIIVKEMRYLGYFRPIRVIQNAVHIPYLPQRSRQYDPTHSLNIAIVGNNSRLKNVAAGAEAFREIKKLYPRAELHIYGEKIEELELANVPDIVAKGLVSHTKLMSDFAQEIDLLIHTSLYETGPVTILEAFGMGIPVIAGRRSGNVPYLFDSDHLLMRCLVDVANPLSIARGVIDLLSDPSIYEATSAVGKKVAETKFSFEKHLDEYEEIYFGLMTTKDLA
jgi:glycosyltransferase involved in cell wall biosynthesis